MPVRTVGLLGTGLMGAGMARSMQRAGLQVTAWNRSPEKAGPLAEDGIRVVERPVDAVRGADAVVTMLYDADAVLEVMGPLVDDVDGVWLQMSTIGPEGTGGAVELAERAGVTLLDAPVLGTRQPAEQGQLVVLVSGDREAAREVEPVLEAVGSRTMTVGARPGSASALKLVVNAWVASLNAAVAQSVALARGLDLDPALFLEAIDGGPTGAPYAQLKGTMMIAGDYPPAFALDNVRKDVGLIRAAAQSADVDTALIDALLEVYGRAASHDLGAADMAAVVEGFQPSTS